MNCNNWFSEYSEHVSCSFVWHQSSRTFQKAPNLKQSRATKIKIRLCHQDSRFLPTAIRFTGSLLGKNGYLPPAGHWDLKPKISRRPEVRSLIPNELILALTVYLPIWHSRCTRTRFTILVSCSDELAIHSHPLLCLQKQVAKLASGLFCRWSLLRSNNMATNLWRFTSWNQGCQFGLFESKFVIFGLFSTPLVILAN